MTLLATQVVVTAGNTHDLVGAGELLRRSAPTGWLLADRAYDTRKLREWLLARGIEPVISPNPTRRRPHPWDPDVYRNRTHLVDAN